MLIALNWDLSSLKSKERFDWEGEGGMGESE